jgi:hypothetical protein
MISIFSVVLLFVALVLQQEPADARR